jgi:hypothetical protein
MIEEDTDVTATTFVLFNQSNIICDTVTSLFNVFDNRFAILSPIASAGPPGMRVMGWKARISSQKESSRVSLLQRNQRTFRAE